MFVCSNLGQQPLQNLTLTTLSKLSELPEGYSTKDDGSNQMTAPNPILCITEDVKQKGH